VERKKIRAARDARGIENVLARSPPEAMGDCDLIL
jgi:hypothetical protein